MKIGVMFPQTDLTPDAGEVKEFVQAVEQMGFRHLSVIEHVVGANRASRPDWNAPYDLDSSFNEPFVLMSYVAALTTTIELATGILILPQRQTVLVAKQAACLDVLCGGRLRLGVGTGWNVLEYEALGENFKDRASRYEDQIGLLRALWTQPALTWQSAHHSVPDVGINPLPIQRPIPLWLGGGGPPAGSPLWLSPASDKVVRRIARLADGWIPNWGPDEHGFQMMEKFRTYCREFGRDPASIGIDGRIMLTRETAGDWTNQMRAWQDIGATHLTVSTLASGLRGCDAHLRRLEEFRNATRG